jgi:hypothetical protein
MLSWVFSFGLCLSLCSSRLFWRQGGSDMGRLLQVLSVVLGRCSWLLLDVNVGNSERSFEVREFMVLSLPLVAFLAWRCVGFALAAF